MTVKDKESLQTIETNLLIVDILMAYDVILGRPALNTIKDMVAPYLLFIQFELDDKARGKSYGDQKMTKQCSYVTLKSLERKGEPPYG